MSEDGRHDYGDVYAIVISGNQRDNITFVEGHNNYHFVPANHDQTKILSGFIAHHIPIYRSIEMEERIMPLQSQIPDELTPIAKKLAK